jgi:hypothetical protein
VSRADPAVISAVVSTTDRLAGVVAGKAGSKDRVSSACSRKAPVSLQSAHYMMDAIQSGH